MTLRGSLQDFPLRSVLDLLAKTKKTGELQVRRDERVGALGVADGRVVTAVFGEEEPLLALGQIFDLETAEFEFTPWDDAPPANLEGGSLDELLKKAGEAKKAAEEARRREEEAREAARKKAEEEAEAERQRIAALRALIPSDDLVFRLSERAVDQGAVTLTPDRWRVVLAVNGERDLNAIAAMLHIDPGAALTALGALVKDGVIETAAPSAAAPAYEPPAAPEPDAGRSDLHYEPTTPAYGSAPPAYEATPPAYDQTPPSYDQTPPSYEQTPPAQEWAATEFAPSQEPDFSLPPERPATAETSSTAQDWITPEQAVPQHDWAASPPESAPVSEVAPQWGPAPEAAPEKDWVTPQEAQPSAATDDRLSALSGIFGPASGDQTPPPPPQEPTGWGPPPAATEHWGTPTPPAPTAERWTAPPPPAPASPDDPWGTGSASESSPETWSPPPASPTLAKDTWGTAPSAQPEWSEAAPKASAASDTWGRPAPADQRSSSMSIPEPGTPPVEEWSPPPAAAPEKKKRGLFGFGREKPAPPPVAGRPLPTAGVVGSRVGMLAALANSLIAEYNSGQYGKGRVEERIANLLMRVDEQADPIDRPLPIIDDRIDVEGLEREHLADSQALPYLALLVTTIFADAERAFGKDKAKKGYKAAQKSVLLGDASVLSSPELAGKLPRV
ncbi:MAG TPA: DUF4388 domain-containing protein [Candidatus Limnocylindria bacterium]|nr:DUF4388 domain-containing protein [Candidatus Limnocylindria bacterium]